MARIQLPHLPRFVLVLPALVVLTTCSMAWSQDERMSPAYQKRNLAVSPRPRRDYGTPDKAIPDKVMHDAKCSRQYSFMVKIGVGFPGGNHGKGVARCRWQLVAGAPPRQLRSPRKLGIALGGQGGRFSYWCDEPVRDGSFTIQQISRLAPKRRQQQVP